MHHTNYQLLSPTIHQALVHQPEVFATGSTLVVNNDKMGILSSLRKLKNQITDVSYEQTIKILNLEPRRFVVDGQTRYGFIAEEVEEVDSNLSEKNDGELSGYDTRGILALLVKLVQDQQEQIIELHMKIADLTES